jgi:hypothetical protein
MKLHWPDTPENKARAKEAKIQRFEDDRRRAQARAPFYSESRNCVDRERCKECAMFRRYYGCSKDITQIENCPILYRLPVVEPPAKPLRYYDATKMAQEINGLEAKVHTAIHRFENHTHAKKKKYNSYSLEERTPVTGEGMGGERT